MHSDIGDINIVILFNCFTRKHWHSWILKCLAQGEYSMVDTGDVLLCEGEGYLTYLMSNKIGLQ